MNFITVVGYDEFKKPIIFGFGWSDWLKEDAIASSKWTVPETLEKENELTGYTTTSIHLSGGELGKEYQVENQITCRDGVLVKASMTIRVMKDPIKLIKKEK